MDEWEQRLWMDQVPVTNRSAKHPVEFTFDGNPIVFKAGETRSLPRHIAVFGIDKTPITTDPRTGATLDSGRYHECLLMAKDLAGYDDLRKEQAVLNSQRDTLRRAGRIFPQGLIIRTN